MPTNHDQGRVVIAGGTGFLGTSLARWLYRNGYETVALGRSKPSSETPARFVKWDARTKGEWTSELEGAIALVNLTGRTVDCIKSPDHCDEILRSRVESTTVLGQALAAAAEPPRVWVQMSTAHIYGDPPTLVCDEDSAFGYGLAPEVAKAWEQACHATCPDSIRKVFVRTSFVVAAKGGAMNRLGHLARLGLGGPVASGKQGFSWIHEQDMNRIFHRAITDDTMSGPYIASAPNPVSQAEFMRALRKAIKMPIGLPAPEFGVRLAAPLVLRTDPELAIYGRYVVPKRLLAEQFSFDFPTVEEAFTDLFKKH